MLKYIFKSAFENLGTKKLFTIASIGTISCSVLIFCIFFVIGTNIHELIRTIETTIGIQVFFDENYTEEEIKNIANKNFMTDDVKSMKFISSYEAWENFKKSYFDGNTNVAEAFEDENPLAKSASYEILLNDISKQEQYVNYIKNVQGVRDVRYSTSLINILTNFNIAISYFSIGLIIVLVLIAIILIANTIAVASQYRKQECEIMKLIGATNFMVKAPFVIEGMLIGFFGTIIPLVIVAVLYKYSFSLILNKTMLISSILTPVPINDFLFLMSSYSLLASVFICIVVSSITINRHINV